MAFETRETVRSRWDWRVAVVLIVTIYSKSHASLSIRYPQHASPITGPIHAPHTITLHATLRHYGTSRHSGSAILALRFGHKLKSPSLEPFVDLKRVGRDKGPRLELCESAIALREERSAVADYLSQSLALGPLEGSIEG